MKLRDIRNPGWFWAQNELFDVFQPLIGVHGVAVYMAMCRLLGDPQSNGRLSLRDIAEASGVSKTQVGRARSEMVALKMIAAKVTGTTISSTFELLDLRAAAEVGPEELRRRLTLSQTRDEASEVATETVPEVKVGTVKTVPPRDSSEHETQHSRGSPDLQLSLPGTVQTVPEKALSQAEGQSAPGLNSLNNRHRERENTRASGALDLVGIAGLIVLAHPRAQMRGWTERDVLYADRIAAIEASRAEAELAGTSAEDAALSILSKIECIAREVPRDQWRFLKEIDKFLRLREYRMQPTDLYRSQGGSNAPTQPNQQHQPAGAQRSAPAQRGANSRTNIGAALERRLRRGAGDADGRDAGQVSEPGTSGGNAGHVPGGMGEDGGPLRAA